MTLHTLGNLTLTRYNSEYSDCPFLEKRDLKDNDGQPCGFAHSLLRLNQGIGLLNHWSEDEIKNRAAQLTDKAVNIWTAPILSADTLKKYGHTETAADAAKYSYENYAEELMGDYWELFTGLRERVLDLDPAVAELYSRYRVVFHVEGHYLCNISAKQTRIRILLHIPHSQVVDPKGMASDATKTYSHDWANGICVVDLKTAAQLDDILALVQQALPMAISLAHTDKANETQADES